MVLLIAAPINNPGMTVVNIRTIPKGNIFGSGNKAPDGFAITFLTLVVLPSGLSRVFPLENNLANVFADILNVNTVR